MEELKNSVKLVKNETLSVMWPSVKHSQCDCVTQIALTTIPVSFYLHKKKKKAKVF